MTPQILRLPPPPPSPLPTGPLFSHLSFIYSFIQLIVSLEDCRLRCALVTDEWFSYLGNKSLSCQYVQQSTEIMECSIMAPDIL